QRVAEAIAEYETQRNSVVNGDRSNTTGTGARTVRPTQECTYKDYLNCGPLKFNGTEGVIGLTRWQNGAGFVWESDVGIVGMVREAGNGEIRGFSGVAGNTVLCTVFQTVKDREGCTILKIFIFSLWG
nr:hypothetical protein [Tanacetum cinerariifolium]